MVTETSGKEEKPGRKEIWKEDPGVRWKIYMLEIPKISIQPTFGRV